MVQGRACQGLLVRKQRTGSARERVAAAWHGGQKAAASGGVGKKDGTAVMLEPKQSGCLCAQLGRNWPSCPASWLRWDGRWEKPSMKRLAAAEDGGHRLFSFEAAERTSAFCT